MRGRKFVGSRLNVMSMRLRKRFIPVINDCGDVQLVFCAGVPSKQMTLSAIYVAMMKSCSTTNAEHFDVRIQRFMTREARTRCSESK